MPPIYRKIRFILLILLTGLIGGIFFAIPSSGLHSTCAFCKESVLSAQVFYEDDLVSALYTSKPVVPGHCLIIPKRHVERFEQLTDEEALRITQVIKKVNVAAQKVFAASSYLLLQKNGPEAGQTVPHVHVHYMPRQTGDHSALKFFFQMYLANIKSPISEEAMKAAVSEMKSAI